MNSQTCFHGLSYRMPIPTGQPTFGQRWQILEGGLVMGFSRTLAPTQSLQADMLTSCMAGIGMKFTTPPTPHPNIENTILFPSIEGVENYDLRVLAVVGSWVVVTAPW